MILNLAYYGPLSAYEMIGGPTTPGHFLLLHVPSHWARAKMCPKERDRSSDMAIQLLSSRLWRTKPDSGTILAHIAISYHAVDDQVQNKWRGTFTAGHNLVSSTSVGSTWGTRVSLEASFVPYIYVEATRRGMLFRPSIIVTFSLGPHAVVSQSAGTLPSPSYHSLCFGQGVLGQWCQ